MTFCSKCGKELADGTRYCPMCGFDTQAQGSSNNNQAPNNYQNYQQPNYNYSQPPHKNRSTVGTIVLVCGIIWAILGLILGLVIIVIGAFADSLNDLVGGGIENTVALIFIDGIMFIVSAVLAIVACVYVSRPDKQTTVAVLCLIGSILAIIGGFILGSLIGILAIIAGVIGIILFILVLVESRGHKTF